VYADYWVAYRLTWETEGRIVATPLSDRRDNALAAEVARGGRPVLVTAARCERRLQAALVAAGIGHTEERVAGVWDVVVPQRRVLPDELGAVC
jgi:hypothetical protein